MQRMTKPISLQTLDFAELYRQQVIACGRKTTSPDHWDKRAEKLSLMEIDSDYARAFIARLSLDNVVSVMDVGCGPGTLSLPLAARVETVYALDYSECMLACLERNAAARHLSNIQTFQYAWQDEWTDIPVCDLLIASRSSMVEDMSQLIDKVNRHARTICLTHQVNHRADRQIRALLQPETVEFPDYIHIINQLYQRGIHPCLDYIETPHRFSQCQNEENFIEMIEKTHGPLTDEQHQRLRTWYATSFARHEPNRWAFITWQAPFL